MIRHIVAWNLKDEFTDKEKERHANKIKTELESLGGKIAGLVSIKVSIVPTESSDREIILETLFTSENALKLYKEHPAHLKAGEFVRSVVKDRVALDFEI